MDIDMKRTICKGCSAILVPGDTAMVRLTKKPEAQVLWVCTMCGAYRVFNTRADHQLWRFNAESVVETIDLNSADSDSAPQSRKTPSSTTCPQSSELSVKKKKENSEVPPTNI
ncbi:unnamed protein product [Nesidiocoris tenuis]|uniref:Uncharacterized protein n=1 Tax=Nesidiocoris tenuis TaxID=355587 RepID=A0A6H5GRK5_9HEMI|nr:unnamed protein product [Nesidiocoris tenuis]